ncbi:hypothetical protein D3C78_1530250 [compost metagenome]
MPLGGQGDAAGLAAAAQVWAEVGAAGAIDGEMVDGRRGVVVALDGRGQAVGGGGGAGREGQAGEQEGEPAPGDVDQGVGHVLGSSMLSGSL